MDATTYIVGLVISLGVMYAIIQNAVRSGSQDLLKQLRLMNKLKIEEMKSKGFNAEAINEIIDKLTK